MRRREFLAALPVLLGTPTLPRHGRVLGIAVGEASGEGAVRSGWCTGAGAVCRRAAEDQRASLEFW